MTFFRIHTFRQVNSLFAPFSYTPIYLYWIGVSPLFDLNPKCTRILFKRVRTMRDRRTSHIAQQERFSFCGAVGDFFFSSHLILFILLFLAYTRISFTRPLNIPVRVCVELIIIMLSTNLQHLSRQSDGTFSVFVGKNKLKN